MAAPLPIDDAIIASGAKESPPLDSSPEIVDLLACLEEEERSLFRTLILQVGGEKSSGGARTLFSILQKFTVMTGEELDACIELYSKHAAEGGTPEVPDGKDCSKESPAVQQSASPKSAAEEARPAPLGRPVPPPPPPPLPRSRAGQPADTADRGRPPHRQYTWSYVNAKGNPKSYENRNDDPEGGSSPRYPSWPPMDLPSDCSGSASEIDVDNRTEGDRRRIRVRRKWCKRNCCGEGCRQAGSGCKCCKGEYIQDEEYLYHVVHGLNLPVIYHTQTNQGDYGKNGWWGRRGRGKGDGRGYRRPNIQWVPRH